MIRLSATWTITLTLLSAFAPAHAVATTDTCLSLLENALPPVALYSKEGSAIADYRKKLLALKPGDHVAFDDGSLFEIRGIFGTGGSTRIFDIGGGKALRVPLSADLHAQELTLLNDFIDGNLGLRNAGIDVVAVDLAASRRDRFAVVEAFPTVATYDDFIHPQWQTWKKLGLSADEEKIARKKFVKFARKFWPLEYLGDFRPEQIGFDGKEWKLLDYGRSSRYIADFGSKDHPFRSYDIESSLGNTRVENGPKDLVSEIGAEILALRAKARARGFRTRPELGATDSEIDFLIHSPYASPIAEGTEFVGHRRGSYGGFEDADDTGTREEIRFKIAAHARDRGKYSSYRVILEDRRKGILVLKNEFDPKFGRKSAEFLRAKKLREKFEIEIPTSAMVRAKGYDYVLFVEER